MLMVVDPLPYSFLASPGNREWGLVFVNGVGTAEPNSHEGQGQR